MPVRRTSLARPVLEVAPSLLGMVLRRTTDEGTVAVRITEVEAYDGPNDPGSHSYRGQTARNAVMFGPPGFLYVYFTYGMHFCMNISVGPANQPSAVLFRAAEIIEGVELARARRGATPPPPTTTPATRPTATASAVHQGTRPTATASPVHQANGPTAGPSPVPPASAPTAAPSPEPPAGRRIADRDLARGPARLCVALGISRTENGADLLSRTSPIQLLPGAPFDGEPATGPRVGLREAADRPWRFWIPGDPTVSPYKPHVPKRRSS